MRKLVISVTGVVLLGAVVAGVSLAAGGARLNGKSKKGKATKISGTGMIHIKGRNETTEKFTFTGTLK